MTYYDKVFVRGTVGRFASGFVRDFAVAGVLIKSNGVTDSDTP